VVILRLISGAVLLLLPGAWFAFGLPLQPLTCTARLALAGVISPIPIALEFYLLRIAGLPFGPTVWVLVALNLCSLVFVVHNWRVTYTSPRALLTSLAVYLVLASCVAYPWLVSDNVRIFTGHSFMHLSLVYQFPEGTLIPEDPELAGLHLAYPWLAHIYWGVLSWALDWSPTRTYVLTNLFWLACLCGLFYEACRHLGAKVFSSRIAMVWLALGTNVIGWLMHWAAKISLNKDWLPGDIRFTPWVRKFITLQANAYAICLFAGIMLVSILALRQPKKSWLILNLVLLTGMGLFYPNLLPPALAFDALLFFFLYSGWGAADKSGCRRTAIQYLLGGLAVLIVIGANLVVLTASHSGGTVWFSGWMPLVKKGVSAAIALAPFLLAIAFLRRESFFTPEVCLFLTAAALSILLRMVFRVTVVNNEYKFMFTSALLLAPVAALAVEQGLTRMSQKILLVMVSVLLVPPAISAVRIQQGLMEPVSFPPVDDQHFWIRLGTAHPDAGWIEAVRTKTPQDTVLVVRRSDLFLPVFTRRSSWVAPESIGPLPGHWINPRFNMVALRGYSEAVYDSRESVRRLVYSQGTPEEYRSSLENMGSLQRPVAIVFPPQDGNSLLDWLTAEGVGQPVFHDAGGTTVWLIEFGLQQSSRLGP